MHLPYQCFANYWIIQNDHHSFNGFLRKIKYFLRKLTLGSPDHSRKQNGIFYPQMFYFSWKNKTKTLSFHYMSLTGILDAFDFIKQTCVSNFCFSWSRFKYFVSAIKLEPVQRINQLNKALPLPSIKIITLHTHSTSFLLLTPS